MSARSLAQVLTTLARRGPVGVAVSGGVDSLTLAAFAATVLPTGTLRLFHARSAAVPTHAAQTLEAVLGSRRLDIEVFDAGEVRSAAYRANPVHRCYFCKSHLFDGIRARFDGAICTGANLDDEEDHRPGRIAARERGVHEPFIEARMTKADVRALAVALDMPDVAVLPASPCLSSRIETGIAIDEATLAVVDAVEAALRARFPAAQALRCRVTRRGPVIEHDGCAADHEDALQALLAPLLAPLQGTPTFRLYRRGSAFLHVIDQG